jgi:hypothetical protein
VTSKACGNQYTTTEGYNVPTWYISSFLSLNDNMKHCGLCVNIEDALLLSKSILLQYRKPKKLHIQHIVNDIIHISKTHTHVNVVEANNQQNEANVPLHSPLPDLRYER